MAAVVFQEEGFEAVFDKLRGANLHAPELLRSELANIAVKKAWRYPERAAELFGRLAQGLEFLKQIRWHDVRQVDVAILASVTGLSAYDATYLWLAGWLDADLVTLDRRLTSVREP
jgi:predicted nucleic acid-binding protein